MDDALLARIRRIYAAIDAIEEEDPNKLKATVIQTDKTKLVSQDFRGGLSDYQLSNQAHMVILSVANLADHLRKWAARNDHDKTRVNQTIRHRWSWQSLSPFWPESVTASRG